MFLTDIGHAINRGTDNFDGSSIGVSFGGEKEKEANDEAEKEFLHR